MIYVYPLSGRPGVDLPAGWNEIPGARGCTPETCGFRDHYAELQAAGVDTVHGLSSQATDYQAELADRLGLPFTVLSDPAFKLAEAIGLPTFNTADGLRLYKRLTMVIADGVIEHVFYPISHLTSTQLRSSRGSALARVSAHSDQPALGRRVQHSCMNTSPSA